MSFPFITHLNDGVAVTAAVSFKERYKHSHLSKPSAKIRWKNSRLDILGSRRHPPHYLPKGQTINAEYYSYLLVQLKDILKEKRRGQITKGSCSCTTMLQLTGHLQPRTNWPTWASNVLITHPILRIWLRRTTTCSLD